MIARNPTIKLPIILNEHTVIEDSDQSSERFGYTLAEPPKNALYNLNRPPKIDRYSRTTYNRLF